MMNRTSVANGPSRVSDPSPVPSIEAGWGKDDAECPRILVAGVGNIFFGDDAFGVEVVHRLLRRQLPGGVEVVDFGIRGLDLAYALLEPYEAVILVDAAPRGGTPGTLYVLEPDVHEVPEPSDDAPLVEAHALDPAKVLRLVDALGGVVRRLLIVGCEPQAATNSDDMQMRLSSAVEASIDRAVALIESLVTQILAGGEKALVCAFDTTVSA
jgi:hydrogenase maturation protease